MFMIYNYESIEKVVAKKALFESASAWVFPLTNVALSLPAQAAFTDWVLMGFVL